LSEKFKWDNDLRSNFSNKKRTRKVRCIDDKSFDYLLGLVPHLLLAIYKNRFDGKKIDVQLFAEIFFQNGIFFVNLAQQSNDK